MSARRSLIRSTLGDGRPEPTAPPAGVRERLRALGVGGAAAAATPAPSPAWDGPALADLVGGVERTTGAGSFLYAERRLPLDHRHGRERLGAAADEPVPLRRVERHPEGPPFLCARDAVFLDTETTGLAGGTGTVAFLVGTGRVEEGELVVRQYGMRDFPEEAAMLAALAEDLGDLPLVTFNGRSFDWPLLVTRFRLMHVDPRPRPHLDLLVPARRLWAASLPSHRLGALEAAILGFERENDLPSELVPQAWFDYLRTRDPRQLARAFAHNVDDVVSMVALMGRVGRALADPTSRPDATPGDAPATARLLLELARPEAARACLEDAAARAAGPELGRILRDLAHQRRRDRAWDEAIAHFERLAGLEGAGAIEACEHLAKIHEHRRRDFEAALAWTRRAMARVGAGSRTHDALRHREARLLRRLGGGRLDAPTAGACADRSP